MKPNPYKLVETRIAYVDVRGIIWSGGDAVYTYQLDDSDLTEIGDFTRDNIRKWLRAHAGDFQHIKDFHAECGETEVDWDNPSNAQEFY